MGDISMGAIFLEFVSFVDPTGMACRLDGRQGPLRGGRAWRDWVFMLTGGNPRRAVVFVITIFAVAALTHGLAYIIVSPNVKVGTALDEKKLAVVTGSAFLSWMLLRRDSWLVSQTMMQVLYILPPALLLRRDFDNSTCVLVVMVPVIVIASGQLAG